MTTTEPWVLVEGVAKYVALRGTRRWTESRGSPARKAVRLWKLKLSKVDGPRHG